MGKIKEKFYEELETTVNYMIKHCGLDDEEANRILLDYSPEEQQEWLVKMEVQADSEYERQKEEEAEDNQGSYADPEVEGLDETV